MEYCSLDICSLYERERHQENQIPAQQSMNSLVKLVLWHVFERRRVLGIPGIQWALQSNPLLISFAKPIVFVVSINIYYWVLLRIRNQSWPRRWWSRRSVLDRISGPRRSVLDSVIVQSCCRRQGSRRRGPAAGLCAASRGSCHIPSPEAWT